MMERGRARLLAEALQRRRRDLEQLPARGHADLYQRYRRDRARGRSNLRSRDRPSRTSLTRCAARRGSMPSSLRP